MFMTQEKADSNKNSKTNHRAKFSLSKILQINKNEIRNELIEETKRRSNRKVNSKKIRKTKILRKMKIKTSQYREKKQRKI